MYCFQSRCTVVRRSQMMLIKRTAFLIRLKCLWLNQRAENCALKVPKVTEDLLLKRVVNIFVIRGICITIELAVVTRRFADTPARGQSVLRLVKSWTGQFLEQWILKSHIWSNYIIPILRRTFLQIDSSVIIIELTRSWIAWLWVHMSQIIQQKSQAHCFPFSSYSQRILLRN